MSKAPGKPNPSHKSNSLSQTDPVRATGPKPNDEELPGATRRRHFKHEGFTAVERLLDQTLSRFGLKGEIARYRFVRFWPEIVGEEAAKRSRPQGIRGGRLQVLVKDSAWAQELSFHKHIILQRIARYASDPKEVQDIVFRVGSLSDQVRRHTTPKTGHKG